MLEKAMDKRLRNLVTIGDAQFGFQPEKGTIDVFLGKCKKVLEKGEKLFFCIFRFGKGLRSSTQGSSLLCMRRREIQEKLVRMFKQHLRRWHQG